MSVSITYTPPGPRHHATGVRIESVTRRMSYERRKMCDAVALTITLTYTVGEGIRAVQNC